MKAIVHTKNKFLHSLGDKRTNNDTEYHALTTACLSMLSQQKKVYANLVKQEQNGMRQISLGPLCSQIRRGGCEGDPMFPKYEACVSNIDRILLEHEVHHSLFYLINILVFASHCLLYHPLHFIYIYIFTL